MTRELPIASQPPPERADAARNRQKIIEVATRMVEANGAANLSLDEVAREANVGVGTVYRRFGDRSGLIYALIDEGERALQEAFMTGPPPIGPGAPPAERIRAFLHALVDRKVAQQELFMLLETGSPKARFSGPYMVHHTHLATLLAEARPEADARFLADALLAPLNACLLGHQQADRGMTAEQIKAGLDDLLRLLFPGSP
ncbi:TetR/AcrR family transcriptional regulator [Nonomuraea africana]|uniref:AcrR family transcriptional regulator n=1 Tax=Nonomuraea africana TaxID=46171 RepID=A0ABR9KPD7_9ACTN|nr:TetR/AcrR family transcriptional regulator [Nonomuraea africana]MBE1563382.1 AcrR family transcriptional regulator [Nonomuraea africana]